MCSSPVMFGGGRQIVYLGFLLCASATNRASASQRAYQPASTARGSKAFGIWLGFSVSLIGRVSSLGGDQARRPGGRFNATEPARVRIRARCGSLVAEMLALGLVRVGAESL